MYPDSQVSSVLFQSLHSAVFDYLRFWSWRRQACLSGSYGPTARVKGRVCSRGYCKVLVGGGQRQTWNDSDESTRCQYHINVLYPKCCNTNLVVIYIKYMYMYTRASGYYKEMAFIENKWHELYIGHIKLRSDQITNCPPKSFKDTGIAIFYFTFDSIFT